MRSGSRLSRTRVPQRGDLRRMSAKDYYAREEMTRGIMPKSRPFVEIFTSYVAAHPSRDTLSRDLSRDGFKPHSKLALATLCP